ncbi:MAG: DUF881 domain-containing protein [Clostridia bacterium]
MNRKQIAITLGIMCFILTVSIFVQIKTIKNTNSTISQSLKENELRDEVLRWKEKYDVAYEQLTQSGKDLEQIRKQATQNDKTSLAKQNEIIQNNMLLGTYEVQGPGIEITLTDNNTGISKDGMEVIDLSQLVVHYDDLLEVINALNNAGAEAISINGQRIVQTTAITCEGNVIKINGQRVSSPFTIKAIGSPGLLYGSVSMIGGYLYWMEYEGVLVDIKQSDNVIVEKYNGVINYKYIKSEK